MRATYVTAIVIAVITGLWLLSGQLGTATFEGEHPTLAVLNQQNRAAVEDRKPTRVRARVIHAVQQTVSVTLRGRTENKRTVVVRAETVGRVIDRPIERGSRVSTGNLLCRISMEDRQAKLVQAREGVNQAEIEYSGSLRLQTKGYQSDTAIASSKARLATARAQLKSSELDIEHTFVRAPFDGMVEATQVELGDYLQPGSACATIVDLDPMLLVGHIAEKSLHRVSVGVGAYGDLTTGETVSGSISFIAQQADPVTRTYRVEVEIDNADYAIRSGITTEIRIPAETVLAHKVSPALFALNDLGAVGVRTLDGDNRVEFHLVDIVRDDVDGVWITGLPERTTLITVGQEFVVPGEVVDAQFESSLEIPLVAPRATRPGKSFPEYTHPPVPAREDHTETGLARAS